MAQKTGLGKKSDAKVKRKMKQFDRMGQDMEKKLRAQGKKYKKGK